MDITLAMRDTFYARATFFFNVLIDFSSSEEEELGEVLLVDWLLIFIVGGVVDAVRAIQCQRVEQLVKLVLDLIVLWTRERTLATLLSRLTFCATYRRLRVLHQLIEILLLEVLGHQLLLLLVDLVLLGGINGRRQNSLHPLEVELQHVQLVNVHQWFLYRVESSNKEKEKYFHVQFPHSFVDQLTRETSGELLTLSTSGYVSDRLPSRPDMPSMSETLRSFWNKFSAWSRSLRMLFV
jgi:hypothetical protein